MEKNYNTRQTNKQRALFDNKNKQSSLVHQPELQ